MTTLNDFYKNLVQIREDYYSNGAIGDANTKLDEMAKLIAIYLYQMKTNAKKFNIEHMIGDHYKNPDYNIVNELKDIFKIVAASTLFIDNSGHSIFGNDPQLTIPLHDRDFTCHILELISQSIHLHTLKNRDTHEFDLLNEAFGHFVRENFRNNIEDAQYMTPPEVVDFMCKIVIEDIRSEIPGDRCRVLDPACGVGSFLVSFNRYWRNDAILKDIPLITCGQDKVERMVRLSFINMLLFNESDFYFDRNNTLCGPSMINELAGTVDVILTNPPFNAKFKTGELAREPSQYYPLLHSSFHSTTASVDSELLFIDKSMSLLKEGGRLLIVVPDSVISAGGLQKVLRHEITKNYTLKGIIELPASTFAQAGTRVKTGILFIQKRLPRTNDTLFIAKSDSLGFDVTSRKGVKIKHESGNNDLRKIADVYTRYTSKKARVNTSVLSDVPSVIKTPVRDITPEKWTPNHFHAHRFLAIEKLKKLTHGVELKTLREIARFLTKTRNREPVPEKCKCISILHIINNSIIDYQELMTYTPKYPGIRCYPGDVLISKINPRIPRVLEVPDYHFPLCCSREFEIMRPVKGVSNQELIALLLLPEVQAQIIHLTSGASSSHRRIKSADLGNIILPIPVNNASIKEKIAEYERLAKPLNHLMEKLYRVNKELHALMS